MHISDLKIKVEQVTEEQILRICNFKRTDIFVFDRFEGKAFEYLSGSANSLIIGSKCLLQCLKENLTIPSINYPLFSLSMNDLIITFSSSSRQEKDQFKSLIRRMGGRYTNNLLTITTHLVVSKVMSDKYNKAVELGIPVMKCEWVHIVWNVANEEDVKATDIQFEHCKCPIFHNLIVTSSGLDITQRTEVTNLINNNGGKYTPNMATNNTDVLIIENNIGDKYKHAKKFNIPCVKPSWIYKCVKKGYAIPFSKHLFQDKPQCSTPNRQNITEAPSFIPSMDSTSTNSRLSAIHGGNEKTVVVNTPSTTNSVFSYKPPTVDRSTPKKGEKYKDYSLILNNMNITSIKKCGPIFDGCKVYLCGFSLSEGEKLRRILNYAGAVRFSELNESVTHIIVGDYNQLDKKQMDLFNNRSPHIVKIEWLRDSINQKCSLPESEYNFIDDMRNANTLTLDISSPLSKKGLQILTPKKNTAVDKGNTINPMLHADEDLLKQYIENKPNEINIEGFNNLEFVQCPALPSISTLSENRVCNGEDSEKTNDNSIFAGLTFRVAYHEDATTEKIVDKATSHGGEVVSDSNVSPDYLIVPIGITDIPRSVKSSETVTFIWLNDCICNRKVMPVLYYHCPMTIPQWETLPLLDCVITFSSYIPPEKMFIEHIAVALGAKCQDVLSKKVNEKVKALKTTHLICRTSEGEKYKAAKKWNLPVVTKDWLLECLIQGQKVPIVDFFVTDDEHGISNLNLKDGGKNCSKIITSTVKRTDTIDENMGNLIARGKCTRTSRLPSSKTFSDINSSFHNSSDVCGRISQKRLNSTPTNPPQFPRLENLSSSFDNVEPIKRDVGKNDSNKSKKYDSIVTTNCVSTLTTSAVITTCSYTGNEHTTTVTSSKSNMSHFVSPATAAVLMGHKSSQKNDAGTEKQSTPDGLLQQMKQVTQLLSNPELGQKGKQKGVKYPFADPARCEKRKFVQEEKEHAQVWWEDDPFSQLNSKKSRTGDDIQDDAEITDYDNLLACCDIPQGNKNGGKSNNEKNFVLSNFSDPNEKRNIEETIRQLGGNVLTSSHYEKQTTHLITNRLIKSEKILCCIAAGKWVLHPTYIKESEKNHVFLPEDNYQWGSPIIKNNYLKKDLSVKSLAEAAVRWRKKISGRYRNGRYYSGASQINSDFSAGAFQGMKATFWTDANRSAAFAKVVEAGGGQVLEQMSAIEATHYFVHTDEKYLNSIPIPLEVFAEKGIHVLPTAYLNDYLMVDPIPDPEMCYIDSYKNILSKIRQ